MSQESKTTIYIVSSSPTEALSLIKSGQFQEDLRKAHNQRDKISRAIGDKLSIYKVTLSWEIIK